MCGLIGLCFFFFKQKTAYEMRISDWSSDVCSSDLGALRAIHQGPHLREATMPEAVDATDTPTPRRKPKPEKTKIAGRALKPSTLMMGYEIGRASCRERVCQYV